MSMIGRTTSRHRAAVLIALVATIALGLASRRYPGLLPDALGKYPGDVLWAQMVYLFAALAFPRWPIKRVALVALTVSYVDELSQLYQAQWIREVRATPVGHLALGSVFDWMDVLSYTIGVALCVAVDLALSQRRNE